MKRSSLIAGAALIIVLGIVTVIWSRARSEDNGLDALVARAVPRIQAATGLTFKTPPVLETRSRAEVRAFLLAQLEDSSTAREMEGQEMVLKRLGLLRDTASLRSIFVDVLEEQIAGYYDPKTKVLYVVDGSPPEMVEVTVTHELIHALQDQYISLDSIQNIRGQDDRQLAAHSIVEGQATLEQMLIMGGDISRLPGGWDDVRAIIREQQSKMPRFSAAPMVIQETLLFPYLSGAEFVRRFKEANKGGNVLENIPLSTEQILNRAAYFDARDNPSEIRLPPLNGVTRLYENSMGEFAIRLFLVQHKIRVDEARLGALGWDGDRYVLFRAGSGTGLLWVIAWDSPLDAAEFTSQVATHFDLRFARTTELKIGAGRYPGIVSGAEYGADDRMFFVGAAEISGKSVVIMVDTPKGTPWQVIDFSRITLSEVTR